MPFSSGNSDSTIGTAPRRPIHARNPFSRPLKRNGSRAIQTATGRATTIRNSATAPAGSATSQIRLGVTSRPSSRNITDCASHAMPSMARMVSSVTARSRLPTIIPVR
ncbi:hypothetical protein D3C85_1709200 [compost metagenome]